MKTKHLTINDKPTKINVRIADSLFTRFLGFMGIKNPRDHAIFFPSCNSIHSFFMNFDIDVFFLDKDYNLIKIVGGFRPWRLILPVKNASNLLEIPSTLSKDLKVNLGDKLNFI